MSFASICIFTQTGRTYTFKDVYIVCDNESVLTFSYQAMSDGHSKTATFPKNTICGWSLDGKTSDMETDMPNVQPMGPPA